MILEENFGSKVKNRRFDIFFLPFLWKVKVEVIQTSNQKLVYRFDA